MWTIEERSGCRAIVDEKGQEITFIDSEPRSFEGKPCGSVTSQGRTAEDLKAITNLIAAAPDLLRACEYVIAYHREHDSGEGELFGLDFVTTCISAINKAKGL